MLQTTSAGSTEVVHKRLRIHDRQLRAALTKAIAEAGRRLGEPECARILTDFVDTADRPLAKNLEALGLTASAYLSQLWFVDGTYDSVCQPRQPRIAAFTERGGRAVYVCRSAFLEVVRQGTAVFVIIHEMLHSLGLGENAPHPTSLAITRQVGRRCRRCVLASPIRAAPNTGTLAIHRPRYPGQCGVSMLRKSGAIVRDSAASLAGFDDHVSFAIPTQRR